VCVSRLEAAAKGGDATEVVGAAVVGCAGGGDAMAWHGQKWEG
jgi:hypothetical protein